MKTMMIAQKPFRKNKCDKKYTVLLSFKHDPNHAKGFGALEHPTATTVVLPEMMPREVVKSMKDVVSHEFFHIVTPLTIHSKEIHYFDYNSPKNVRTFMDVRRSNRIFCQSFQIKG
jgi:predicted metalloprotease with PDZ domain